MKGNPRRAGRRDATPTLPESLCSWLVSGSRPTVIAEAQHRPLTTDTEVRDDEAEISYLRKNGTKYHCWQHYDCNPFASNSISHAKSNLPKSRNYFPPVPRPESQAFTSRLNRPAALTWIATESSRNASTLTQHRRSRNSKAFFHSN